MHVARHHRFKHAGSESYLEGKLALNAGKEPVCPYACVFVYHRTNWVTPRFRLSCYYHFPFSFLSLSKHSTSTVITITTMTVVQEFENLVHHGVFETRVNVERRRIAAIERRAREEREREAALAAAAAKAAAERGASGIDPLTMMALMESPEEMEEPRTMARESKISVKEMEHIIKREEVTSRASKPANILHGGER